MQTHFNQPITYGNPLVNKLVVFLNNGHVLGFYAMKWSTFLCKVSDAHTGVTKDLGTLVCTENS
jgi:hypothetical protein